MGCLYLDNELLQQLVDTILLISVSTWLSFFIYWL